MQIISEKVPISRQRLKTVFIGQESYADLKKKECNIFYRKLGVSGSVSYEWSDEVR